jgi:hypothetical protein
MPVTETPARLWFDSEEEIREYDDKMISNIELKSLDFDDENFSPVFNRATQEVFLKPSERFKSDLNKLMTPIRGRSLDELIDKYILFKPNHTFYRQWPIDKFFGGFALSYFAVRELPFRNFYARVFIMSIFFAKMYDHMNSPLPFFGPQFNLNMALDRWYMWDLRCYDVVWKATRFIEIPSTGNRVRESRVWNAKQPGHILRADFYNAAHYLTSFGRPHKDAHWDGTQNMPLYRLADPQSKDSYMMHFT